MTARRNRHQGRRPWGRAAMGAMAVLTATGAAWGGALPGPVAQAKPRDAGDGTVTVRVVREVNANGAWDAALEPGWSGVQVTLTDDAGVSVTGTTGADGTVELAPGTTLTGGKYRVQALNPDATIYSPAFASQEGLSGAPTKLSSAEEFVDLSGGKSVELTTGFWNPDDYCQSNPTLATCLLPDETGNTGSATDQGGPYSPEDRTLVTVPFNGRGDNVGAETEAESPQTGAINGLGYDKVHKKLYSAAFSKRLSAFGPGGPNAVYMTDPATNETSQFATVPGDDGATTHDMDTYHDLAFAPKAGKTSLGDLDVNPDGSELYVVGLSDKTLYTYDTSDGSAPERSVAIPDPGCAGGTADWRPGALDVQDGVVYVGGVCSGESTGSRDDMRAVVMKYDPAAGTFGDVIMNDPLDFPRGAAYEGSAECPGAGWFTWSDDTTRQQNGNTCTGEYGFPQPLMMDIEVDTDGALILGFRDRFPDQGGQNVEMAPGGAFQSHMLGGDINRACLTGGTFVLDGNGGCRNNGTPDNNGGEPDDVLEFYPGDNRLTHDEMTDGGLALSKPETDIAVGAMDPISNIRTGGVAFLDRTDGTSGAGDGNQLATSFGKGGSIGDMEVLCDLAPLQIGNRVWYDVDKDGIQDPGEAPVPGATVSLYDESGTKIASTTTSDRGEYYFDSTLTGNVPADAWNPDTAYKVAVDNPDDYAEGGPLYKWVPTTPDAGTNDFIDSDGVVPAGGTYPEHTFTTGGPGENNHSYDFGFNADFEAKVEKTDADTGEPLPGAVFQLWRETNGTDGLQRNGADPDTQVDGNCTTGADGVCDWTGLEPGAYYFYEVSSPAGYMIPAQRVTGPFTLDAATTSKTVELTNALRHRIAVHKVDAKTGKPLAGATYQLWEETNGTDGLQTDGVNPDTQVGDTCTTNARGVCRWRNLDPGTYYAVETAAPDGYLLPDEPVVGPLTIDNANPSFSVKQKNERRVPSIDIEKKDERTDSDADTPASAVIGPKVQDEPVYMTIVNNGTEDLVHITVTDEVTAGDGQVKDLHCDFPDGTSADDPAGRSVRWEATWAEENPTVFEVGASFKCTAVVTGVPAGRLHTDNATVNGAGATSGDPVDDSDPWNWKTPGHSITINKKDADNGDALQGAVFQLWEETNGTEGLQRTGDDPDTLIDSGCATNARGRCTWTGLESGSYYLVETDAPEGYVLPRNPVTGPVEVDSDHDKATYTLKNRPQPPNKKK
ncbi:SpaA isopeptide-forming pilin-related protein [Streptomyces sp. NBC_00209]|uniref:SpaA isopeptide-forming pilin-related protein n=1 Tax=Streptomyces sp. NBC_00209 TaxID=2975682 RepID=UPI00324D378B